MRKEFGGNEENIKEKFYVFEGTIPEFIEAYKITRNLPIPQPIPKF